MYRVATLILPDEPKWHYNPMVERTLNFFCVDFETFRVSPHLR